MMGFYFGYNYMGDIMDEGMLWLGLFLVAFLWWDKKRLKKIGNIGERIVRDRLNELPDNFIVLNNVRYWFKKCQIDHMVICNDVKLIFVIETKMWGNDKVYGDPVKQNEYHCRVVRNKFKGYRVINVVTFVGSIPYKFRAYKCVVNENELIDMVNRVYNRYIIEV